MTFDCAAGAGVNRGESAVGSGAGVGMANPKLAFGFGRMGPDALGGVVFGVSGPERAGIFAVANGFSGCEGWLDTDGAAGITAFTGVCPPKEASNGEAGGTGATEDATASGVGASD